MIDSDIPRGLSGYLTCPDYGSLARLPTRSSTDAHCTDPMWTIIRALYEITELEWSDQIARMQEILSVAAAEMGVRYFDYHIVRCPMLAHQQQAPLSFEVSTFPDSWTARYTAEGYAVDNPILAEAVRTSLPFTWSSVADSRELNPREREFFAAAAAEGLDASLAIPVHFQGEVAVFSVVPADHEAVDRCTHLLYLMAYYLHLKLRRPVVEAALTASSRRRSLLTPRETQVLERSAHGKSSGEISAALGISLKSVEFHIEGAKRKLQVANRTHAVAKAIMLGLVCGEEAAPVR